MEQVPFLADRDQELRDSLEAAWDNATEVLGAVGTPSKPIDVFVTASRTRFPQYLRPYNRGLATISPTGDDLIILVHNDSVRAYFVHEVTHVVARRALGPAVGRPWLQEGLATFSDGQCQTSTIYAVARDYLRQQPFMSISDITDRFPQLLAADRATGYALAGTLVGYVMEVAGRDGLRRLWRSRDPGSEILEVLAARRAPLGGSASLLPALAATEPSAGWREHVGRQAGNRSGLATNQLLRFGCG